MGTDEVCRKQGISPHALTSLRFSQRRCSRSAQERLATKIWLLVKPGGAILWYDFIFDNPANPDVKGMPRRRVLELFPQAKVSVCKITLAPPIARAVCRFHPGLYSAFNLFCFLRTHLVGWLEKPLGKPAATGG